MFRYGVIFSVVIVITVKGAFVYEDKTLYEGSACVLPNGHKGFCRFECSHPPENFRDNKICGFEHKKLLLCCPETDQNQEYPSLQEACTDRSRRIQERIKDDEDINKRRLEEVEIVDRAFEEYSSLPAKFWARITKMCEEEANIVYKSEEERSKYVAQCETLAPRTNLASPVAIYPSKLYQHPHMSALGWYNFDKSISWNCGGSLIHRVFVLTAAHCLYNIGTPPDIIRIGDVELTNTNDDDIAVNYEVEKYFVHEGYKPPAYYNDVAIIKIKKLPEFRYKPRPLPACIWTKKELPAKKLLMMGYGAPAFGKNFLEKLYEGNLTALEHDECVPLFRSTEDLPNGIVPSQLCARDPEGILDTCEGDSGGPLQYNSEDPFKTPYIVAVTSFGILCVDGNPGVYTRLLDYLGWIEKTINENYP